MPNPASPSSVLPTAVPPRPGERHGGFRHWLPPWAGGGWSLLLLVAGLSVTAVAVRQARSEAVKAAHDEFDTESREIEAKIVNRLEGHEQILRSGAAFLSAHPGATRTQWREFAERQKISQKLPGIQGFGFALVVPAGQLGRHIREIRAEGFPDYRVWPEGERATYTAIIYLEPFRDRNLRAFGYDMLTEATRREAMERARDTDAAALSGPVTLVQETDRQIQKGTLMFVPVYRSGAPLGTATGRRDAHVGWVYSPYRMNDLMQGILGQGNLAKEQDTRLRIFDGNSTAPGALLYDSQQATGGGTRTVIRFARQSTIDAAGRRWLLDFSDSGKTGFAADYSKTWLWAAGGTIISLLLTGLALSLANTRRNARQLAGQLTAELRASEERWQFALEGAGDGVWDWDVSTSRVYFSRRWKQMLGHEEDEIGHGLEEWSSRVHPEDMPRVLADLQPHLDGRTAAYVNEHRMRCKDGSYKWILDRGLVISRDAAGKPLRVVGTHSDISARKEAESALRASEERYRSVLAAMAEGLVVHGRDGGILAANPAAGRILGRTLAELQERKDALAPADAVHEDGRPFPPESHPTLITLRTGVGQTNVVLGCHRPDGERRWISINTQPLAGAEGASAGGVITTFRDITAHKQAEVQLRESQLVYRSFVEQLPAAVFRKDRAGRYVMVNPVFCRLKNLAPEDFLGRTPLEVAALQLAKQGPDSRATDYANEGEEIHAQIIRTGQAVETEEEYPGADGQPVYMHVVRMPVFAPDGTVVGVQGIQIDLTSRKRAEARLAEANRIMQAEKDERTRAVAQARAAQDETARMLTVAEESRRALLSVVEDHRAVEQALRESEAHYRHLFEHNPMPMLVYERGSLQLLAVNEAFERHYGYDRAAALALHLPDLYPEEEKGPITELSRTLKGHVYAGEWHHHKRDGTLITIEAHSHDIHFGGRDGRIAVITDITERKHAEAALRESEQRYRELFDLESDAILLLEAETGRIIQANQAAGTMYGYSVAELETLRNVDLSAEPEQTLQTMRSRGRDAGAVVNIPLRQHRRRDGGRFPAEINLRFFERDGRWFYLAAIRDITLQVAAHETLERFNTELEQMVASRTEELAARTRQIQALLHAIPDTVMRLRTDGTLLHSQRAHGAPGLAAITPPEGAPPPAGAPAALLESSLALGRRALAEKTTVAGETEITTPGGLLTLELRTAPTGTEEFVVFARDITSRKRLEAETAAMLEKERQVSEMKSRFVSLISHEFRTPMTAIMGSVDLLANHLDHLSEEKRAQLFARINASLHRMAVMLEDVLTLNRMDAKRTEVRLSPVNLAPYIHNIVQETRVGDHEAHVFAVHLPEVIPPFVTDPNLLHHILSNLFGNAVHYSPPGTTVSVRVWSDAWRVHVSVEDQGIGIPPADRARIFEPFERGSNVGHIKGTGLGLNIVKRMTVLLGGHISLRAAAGGGTRFTVALPLQPSSPPAPSP